MILLAHSPISDIRKPRSMPCDEKTRLLDVYLVAVDHYATAASTLSARRGERLAFMKALRSADFTRQEAVDARLALKDHKEKHGC